MICFFPYSRQILTYVDSFRKGCTVMIHILYGGLTIAAGIGMFFLPKENSWIAAIGFIVIGAIIFGYGMRRWAAGKKRREKQRKIARQMEEREQQKKNRKALEDLLR